MYVRPPLGCGSLIVPCAGWVTISNVSESSSSSVQGGVPNGSWWPASTSREMGPKQSGGVLSVETFTWTVETADWPPRPSEARW